MPLVPPHVARALDPSEVVLRFLESIGKRSEAEFYLGLFKREAEHRFATLVIDAPVVADASAAVGLDLRFLQALGLTPVVCLGLFDAVTQGVQATRLKAALLRVGLTAERFLSHDTDAIAASVKRGTVPIVLLGATAKNADARLADPAARACALASLVVGLGSRKLLFLQRRGGLPRGGKSVPQLTLVTSLAALTQTHALTDKQRVMVGLAQVLLKRLDRSPLTVAIISPLQLLRELFTVKGAGTLLRRGARISRYDNYGQLDGHRLRSLLQNAFSRPVHVSLFADKPQAIYVDAHYQAAAITQATPLGAYLSPFVVGQQAQGEGLYGDLWQTVTQDNAALFGRSRRNNLIDPWSVRQCEAMVRRPEYNVFVRGMTPDHLSAVVHFAESAPADVYTDTARPGG